MLGVPVLDFMNYKNALKGNYRKGVHVFRSTLANPRQAEDFASNLGGTSVVLGVPPDYPDRNSGELLNLLANSPYMDQATLTWLSQWFDTYTATADTLVAESSIRTELSENALLWRAVSLSDSIAAKFIVAETDMDTAQIESVNMLLQSELSLQSIRENAKGASAYTRVYRTMKALITYPGNITTMTASENASFIFSGTPADVATAVISEYLGYRPDTYLTMSDLLSDSEVTKLIAAEPKILAYLFSNVTCIDNIRADSNTLKTIQAATDAVCASTICWLLSLDNNTYKTLASILNDDTIRDRVINSYGTMAIFSGVTAGINAWKNKFGDKVYYEVYGVPPTAEAKYGTGLYAFVQSNTPSTTGTTNRPTRQYNTSNNEPWGPKDNYTARQTYYVYSLYDGPQVLQYSADDGNAVYCNGEYVSGAPAVVSSVKIELHMRKGWNKLEWLWNEGAGDAGCFTDFNWYSNFSVTMPTDPRAQ